MFHRAFNNSSNGKKAERSVDKIRLLLLKNWYSPKLLKRLLREVRLARAAKQDRRQAAGDDGFFTLPYVDERLLCKVKNVVKRSGLKIRLAWRNENKLKNQLVRSSFARPRCPGGNRCHLCKSGFRGGCTQKNIVYQLKCKICNSRGIETEYVGETKRPLRLRYNEHVRDMLSRKEDTPMGDHFRLTHPDADDTPSPFDVKVLYRAKDHPDRKIVESILIRNRKPKLNSNVSSWPIM